MPFWSPSRYGAIAVLTFARPPRNLINTAAMTELQGHLEGLAKDPDVQLVVLAGGIDGYFIAHADIDDVKVLAEGRMPEGDPNSWRRCWELLGSMPQPTVAAIDGQAWGGGLELALACTMRVGSSRAHVALPEVSIGIMPGGGGTQRLARLVGPSKAAELILSGRLVRAEEAEKLGIFNAVLPAEGFLYAVVTWCQQITRNPARAVLLAKQAVVEGHRLLLAEGLELEARLFTALNQSDDAKARIARLDSTQPESA